MAAEGKEVHGVMAIMKSGESGMCFCLREINTTKYHGRESMTTGSIPGWHIIIRALTDTRLRGICEGYGRVRLWSIERVVVAVHPG